MKDRVVEPCPVCGKTAVWIDIVQVPQENGIVIFQSEPGIISCAECEAELELSVHSCGRHALKVL